MGRRLLESLFGSNNIADVTFIDGLNQCFPEDRYKFFNSSKQKKVQNMFLISLSMIIINGGYCN